MSIRDAIVAEALTWQRTPYHHLADVKGIGTDCAMFPIRVYQNAAGLLMNFDPRPYAPEWHLHRSEELYLQGLATAGAWQVESPKLGDIVMFKYGRCVSHGGIVVSLDGHMQFIHAALNDCVTLARIDELDYAERLHSFWSIIQ